MKPSHETILGTISSVVAGITRDWGVDSEPTATTRLNGDLGFTSMDVIDLFATLEVKFQRKLPYEAFITVEGGGYRSELTLGELADFVNDNFDNTRPDPTAV
jgi:acyl carrier protein